ncbi:response regulator [Balneolaceae bacterium ANBcel3]|nr:response regulator [Balneolaceae bacterium ANBcel3]
MASKKILYIEDDLDNHTLIKLFLRNTPWELSTSESAGDALKVMEEEDFSAFIVDLNLQDQGDGADVIQEIRKKEKYQETPIIVFSGFDEQHFKKYNVDHLTQSFFRKPTSKKVLLEALNDLLGTE